MEINWEKVKRSKGFYYAIIAIGWGMIIYSAFLFGSVYTCANSGGFLTDELKCNSLLDVPICSYQGRFYHIPEDINFTLEKLG